MPLCGTVLAKDTAGSAFGNTKRVARLINAPATTRGA